MIEIADTDDKLRDCFPVMVQLRPHLDLEKFLSNVKRQQEAGYQIIGLRENNKVVAVAGFRIANGLAWGKFLYVDDLITDENERSKGYGKQCLDWLIAYAEENVCEQFHLDSGVQRKDAHRFYEREGMSFTSHHYSMDL